MPPLSLQNIESELSYAYLHAVAGKAGISCKCGDRHDDNAGVDAQITYRGQIPNTYLKNINIDVQLKATIQKPGNYPNHLSYFIKGKSRYEALRNNDSDVYKVLIVLFLPEKATDWLKCGPDELVLKEAAYWVCLYGAPASINDSGQTVYIPKANLLSPDNLEALAHMAALKTIPPYTTPLNL